MPSEVWKYFERFDGGAKCRLCGIVRNRKDKSTSTFWQHLKKIHKIIQPKSYSKVVNEDSVKKESQQYFPTNINELLITNRKLEIFKNFNTNFEVSSLFTNDMDQQIMNLMETNNPIETIDNIEDNPLECLTDGNKSPIKRLSASDLEEKMSVEMLEKMNIPTEYANMAEALLTIKIQQEQQQNSVVDTPPTTSFCSFSNCSSTMSKVGEVEEPVNGLAVMEKKREDFIKWDEFFMGMALLAAQRSKDPATQVGAVLANEDNIIIGIGYNGMPIGCSDDEFPWGKTSENELERKYTYVCHAEMNAILNKNSESARNSTIYCSMFPCNECAKLIIQSRIRKVVYLHDKPGKNAMIAAKKLFTAVQIPYIQYVPSRKQIVLDFSTPSNTSL